jgi:hypothetical protein
MNEREPHPGLDRLLGEARAHLPFGEAPDFGFETRLRAALAAARPGLGDCLAALSWRFAAAGLPLALGAALFLAMSHRHALPDGLGGLVTQWAGQLPLPL